MVITIITSPLTLDEHLISIKPPKHAPYTAADHVKKSAQASSLTVNRGKVGKGVYKET